MGDIQALVVVLVVLMIAVQYSVLRAKYRWLFSWYYSLYSEQVKGTPSDIGPMRIALAYEWPWLAKLWSRPLPQPAAEFMIRLIKLPIDYEFLAVGPGVTHGGLKGLNALVATKAAWGVAGNPLYTTGLIPYDSDLVTGYVTQLKGSGQGDLSLGVLWLYGYEEYVRQRFSAGNTSAMGEWNYMFAAFSGPTPQPVPGHNKCGAGAMAGGLISAGIAGAGVGAMIGAPADGVGALPGALAGFVVGAAGSLLGKTNCL